MRLDKQYMQKYEETDNREHPIISVIIPVYKVEPYLDHCIESVVNQTYQNLEIILVDDGSPDRCPEMCDDWASRDGRIIVIHKPNGGLSDARNAGMAIASGEYIGFVDSDDWIAPEMYGKLLSTLITDESDIAACSVSMVWEDGSPARLLTVEESALLNRSQAQRALLEESLLKQPVWYKLYKTSLIRDIPFEAGKYHEDVYWSYQAIGKAEKVSIIPYIGYYYFQRSGSIMGDGYSLKRLDAMEAYCRRYEYLKNAFPELNNSALTAIWLNCIYHGQMAMKYTDHETQRRVFSYLREILARYPIRHGQYNMLKWTHRIWLDIARTSLPATAFIKKTLNVGW